MTKELFLLSAKGTKRKQNSGRKRRRKKNHRNDLNELLKWEGNLQLNLELPFEDGNKNLNGAHVHHGHKVPNGNQLKDTNKMPAFKGKCEVGI